MIRRGFIKNMGALLMGSGVNLPGQLPLPQKQVFRLDPEKPKAIAMWDFSWLLRTYEGGGFENWDKALDELVERGYNALRIDCFPQLIALDSKGAKQIEYNIPAITSPHVLWGNAKPVKIQPEEQLITFLNKCKERDIPVALSSWFYDHGTGRSSEYRQVEGLVRAWNEALLLVEQYDLMDLVLYVDVLNEYPLWHGYNWLTAQLNDMSETKSESFDFLNLSGSRQYSQAQIQFYNQFISSTISILRKQWPDLSFTASQTNTHNTPWTDLDSSSFQLLDIHLWLVYHKAFSQYTGYFDNVHTYKSDAQFGRTNDLVQEYMGNNRLELYRWLEECVIQRKLKAEELGVPVGSTEGWGPVMWMEHPEMDWNFVKESGLMGAELGAKHNYSFNCSSNFTHPHFKKLWADINWHKEVTTIIKKAS